MLEGIRTSVLVEDLFLLLAMHTATQAHVVATTDVNSHDETAAVRTQQSKDGARGESTKNVARRHLKNENHETSQPSVNHGFAPKER